VLQRNTLLLPAQNLEAESFSPSLVIIYETACNVPGDHYELLNSLVIWHTHISGRIHTIRLIIRVEVSEWCYTSTIDCHTDRSSWFIISIIDVKMIIMSVSIEYCCYCIFKPENKHAHYKNLLHIVFKCAHMCMFFR